MLLYCEFCKKKFTRKNFFKHKYKKTNKTMNNLPQEIIDIILKYKYELEIYQKYRKFEKFLKFYDSFKSYENMTITYNCYREKHYLDDIIYIMKNHYKDLNFDFVIRNMISKRKLKSIKINRQIYKLKIEYNIYNQKFYIKYL